MNAKRISGGESKSHVQMFVFAHSDLLAFTSATVVFISVCESGTRETVRRFKQ